MSPKRDKGNPIQERKYTSKYDKIKMKIDNKYHNPKSKNNKSSNKLFGIFIITLLVFGSLLISGVFSPDTIQTDDNPSDNWNNYNSENNYDLLLYSSPTCGCCEEYVNYLEENGYTVDFRKTNELQDLKNKLNIPAESRSCHTVKLGNYFIEGHIPIEVISELLQATPELDGISLPGMPAGSPGMSGVKNGDFTIQAIAGGNIVGTFMEI